MASFVVERHGFIDAKALMASVIQDMLANGFTIKYPSSFSGTEELPFRVILEASTTVDPLAASQPWRVCFEVPHIQTAFIFAGTPITLPDSGVLPIEQSVTTTFFQGNPITIVNPAGDITGSIGDVLANPETGETPEGVIDLDTGIWNPKSGGNTKVDSSTVGFINRRFRTRNGNASGSPWTDFSDTNSASAFPMSYRLVISPRGFWLGVWDDAFAGASNDYFNWVLIQRPVDRNTGEVITTGKSPVFCVNKVGASHWQFVVREADVLRPGARRSASADTEDSEGILNIENQVGLSEDGKYVVTFPSRLNTSRYRYPHELDMIATTSSDVVSQYSDVPLEVYGEEDARIYKALFSNKTNSTGMRLLVLNEGGGVGS